MFQTRDLPLLAVLVAVARRSSFTAAARDLDLSKSVVSDHVRTLEQRCNARLVERTTRRVRLTQIGESVLGIATSVVESTRDIDAILEEHKNTPVGTLRVATTHDLGRRYVGPLVARIAAKHRQLKVDLVMDDASRDLVGENCDVAIRLGRPRSSELVMRKLRVFEEQIVGAPALVAMHPRLVRPRDLAVPWVRHSLLVRSDTWRFENAKGEIERAPVHVRAQANTGDGVKALLLGGVGFGVMPEYQMAADLESGALVRVCPDWIWREVTLYAAMPPGKRRPKRVELFLEALHDAVLEP